MVYFAAGGTTGRPAQPGLRLKGRVWHYRFTVGGERYEGSTREHDRTRAEAALAAKWHEAHRKARLKPAPGQVALDFGRVCSLWLASLGERAGERNPQYVTRHKLDTEYLLNYFRLPGDVTDEAWQEAMRKLHEAGLAWSSLRHVTVTLRHVVRFAAQLGAIASAPELNPPPGRLVNKEQAPRRSLTEGERDRVLAAMRANGDARAARIWTVMAYSGLRRGEVARLTLRALDRHAGVLHVFGKSGHHEQVALHPEVARAVRAEAIARGVKDRDVPVFGGFDLRKAWKRALARARVDKHGTTAHHTARHTFGTLVAQMAKGDVTAVQAAGRWRSLSMVQRYVHADAARARAAIRRL